MKWRNIPSFNTIQAKLRHHSMGMVFDSVHWNLDLQDLVGIAEV